MEKALKYELTKAIPELEGAIYPTNAPKNVKRPYLVYARISTKTTKTLDGYTGDQALSYMYSVMAVRYEDMQALTQKVVDVLLSLPQKRIGRDGAMFVSDLEINNVDETWENELNVNRGIIDFTVYKEE